MRTHVSLALSLCLAAAAAGCNGDRIPTATPNPPESLERHSLEAARGGTRRFSKFVAMGTSQTAGTMSGGLFAQSQKQAWPAQLARLADIPFSKPLLDGFGCPAPVIAPLDLQLRANGDTRANVTSCSALASGVLLPTQNLAIPNVLTSDALFTTPEMAAAANPVVGRLYSRILPAGATQVSAMRAQHPRFVAVEFGGVEIISNTRLGSVTPIVTFEQWAPLYDQVIAAVNAERARAVLVSFPERMAIWPGLRSGAELFAERDAFAQRYIAVSAECGTTQADNLVYLPRKVFQALSAAATARAGGLPPPVLTCNDIPGTLDAVLTPAEVSAVDAQWTRVNAYIRATAEANGFAHFSLNLLFTLPGFRPAFKLETLLTSERPYGPYMSLDDLHPNAFGEAILAIAAARALATTYSLHIR